MPNRYRVLTTRGPWPKGSIITEADLGGHQIDNLLDVGMVEPADKPRTRTPRKAD